MFVWWKWHCLQPKHGTGPYYEQYWTLVWASIQQPRSCLELILWLLYPGSTSKENKSESVTVGWTPTLRSGVESGTGLKLGPRQEKWAMNQKDRPTGTLRGALWNFGLIFTFSWFFDFSLLLFTLLIFYLSGKILRRFVACKFVSFESFAST